MFVSQHQAIVVDVAGAAHYEHYQYGHHCRRRPCQQQQHHHQHHHHHYHQQHRTHRTTTMLRKSLSVINAIAKIVKSALSAIYSIWHWLSNAENHPKITYDWIYQTAYTISQRFISYAWCVRACVRESVSTQQMHYCYRCTNVGKIKSMWYCTQFERVYEHTNKL